MTITRLGRYQRGGTAAGFLVGVIVGLAVAAGVALTVSRAPMPFVNNSDKVNATIIAPQSGVLPDPNAAMTQADPAAAAAPGPAPAAGTTAAVAQPAPGTAPAAGSQYLLQAGAYRSETDAQAMRARLALIGYEAQIRTAKVNNDTLYRVRVGPFQALDAMNTARSELANNGIEAAVVRQ